MSIASTYLSAGLPLQTYLDTEAGAAGNPPSRPENWPVDLPSLDELGHILWGSIRHYQYMPVNQHTHTALNQKLNCAVQRIKEEWLGILNGYAFVRSINFRNGNVRIEVKFDIGEQRDNPYPYKGIRLALKPDGTFEVQDPASSF